MYENVIIGNPLYPAPQFFASSAEDWRDVEIHKTMFTEERYLPAIMKEAGIVSSTSEVRRNRKDLCITLNKPDFLKIKWGKKFLFILVGE